MVAAYRSCLVGIIEPQRRVPPYCPFLPGPPSETKFPTRLNTYNNAKQSPLRSAECVPTVRLGARLNVTPRSRRAATLLYEPTRNTTRRPSCSGAMPCYARVRGGRRGGDPWMACKGSGVQIPSAPPHFTRSNGVKLGKQAGTEPQQNPNPAATPLPGRLNAKQATVDSERRYPCWRGPAPEPA